MLSPKDLKAGVKTYMGPVFIAEGFTYKYEGGAYTWIKTIENSDYKIGIGLFVDSSNKTRPEFRFTLFVDPEDIRDIRAYRYSGIPPSKIRKLFGIKVSLLDRLSSFGYDAWLPLPNHNPEKYAYTLYANHLIQLLEKKKSYGKRLSNKTHRWNDS